VHGGDVVRLGTDARSAASLTDVDEGSLNSWGIGLTAHSLCVIAERPRIRERAEGSGLQHIKYLYAAEVTDKVHSHSTRDPSVG
jgi:hypothetical protein